MTHRIYAPNLLLKMCRYFSLKKNLFAAFL